MFWPTRPFDLTAKETVKQLSSEIFVAAIQ
jgi:hypothetical protein